MNNNEKGESISFSHYTMYSYHTMQLPLAFQSLSSNDLSRRLSSTEIITHTPPLHTYNRDLDSPL
jgi:hypothetical protein